MMDKAAIWELLKRWGAKNLAQPTVQEALNETLARGTGTVVENIASRLEPALERHIPDIGQTIGRSVVEGADPLLREVLPQMGESVVRGAEKRIEPIIETKLLPFLRKIQKEIPDTVSNTIEQGTEQLADTVAGTARNLSAAAGMGGASGAVAAPDDERIQGALRGSIGGLLGGAGGAAWGRLLQEHSLLPAIGGAILGGAAGGATLRGDERTFGDPGMESPRAFDKESAMQGHKYAGVTLDWYDDHGETLKQKFPTLDKVPDIIKEANIKPKEKLANEDFALIMVDKGHVFRKFACADAGTTAMSVIYFMEHGDKLPEEAQKLAASNLVAACMDHNLMPPAELTRKSGGKSLHMLSSDEEAQKVASVVDVTGKRPKPLLVKAGGCNPDDYAVVMPDGSRHYPIQTWDLVKKAESYYLENQVRFQPEIRRQYAVKLANKAQNIGYPLDGLIMSHGSTTYAPVDDLKDAIDMRKVACAPGHSREFLDDLFSKHASIHPEVYAECLKRFDVAEGLDKGWDRVVPDPWSSTFGTKTAAYEVIWEEGADRVTRDALEDLAENHLHLVTREFTYDVAKEFKKDPIGIFESMPSTHKKILARLASDAESDGTSEKGTNTVPFEKKAFGPVELRDKEAGWVDKTLNPHELAQMGGLMRQLSTSAKVAPKKPAAEVMKVVQQFKKTQPTVIPALRKAPAAT